MWISILFLSSGLGWMSILAASLPRNQVDPDQLKNFNTLTVPAYINEDRLGLIGYDCTGPNTTVSPISLRGLANCLPAGQVLKTRTVRIQLLQKKLYMAVHVYSCKVSVFRYAFYCGHYSHNSMVANGIFSYIKYLGASECQQVHQTGTINIPGIIHMVSLTSNTTHRESVTLYGELSSDGTCSRGKGKFVDPGGSFEGVTIAGYVEVTLMDFPATAILEEKVIIFERQGITCGTGMNYCQDRELGEFVWTDSLYSKCDPLAVDVLYEGEARVSTYEIMKSPTTILIIEKDDKLIGLKLTYANVFCGFTGWKTDHSRLLVAELGNLGTPFLTLPLNTKNIDLSLYVNTKIMFVVASFYENLQEVINYVQLSVCETRRQLLLNRLSIVQSSPELAGLLVDQIEGHYGRVMGEILYLTKCDPVPVTPRSSGKCSQELPVLWNNEEWYISPITRTLTKDPSEVSCVPNLKVGFSFGAKWWSRSPRLDYIESPTILDPNPESLTLEYRLIFDISSRGLYTEEEMMSLQREMMFPVTREAQQVVFARKLSGSPTGSYLSLFSSDDISSLTDTVGNKLSWFFAMFGHYAATIIACAVILKLLITIIDTILNCRTMRARNVRWYQYPLAILNSFTHWITYTRIEVGAAATGKLSSETDTLITRVRLPPRGATDDWDTVELETEDPLFPKIFGPELHPDLVSRPTPTAPYVPPPLMTCRAPNQ